MAQQAAAETPPEFVDERQALRATEFAAARYGMGGEPSPADLAAEPIEGDGPGAKMLAAMVSFGLAMTGPSAERMRRAGGACARRRRAHRRRPGPVPRPRADGAHLADREEAVAGWEKLLALAHRRGSLLGVLSVNLWSGRTLLWRGELREAQERLEAANERFAEWGRTRSRVTYGPAFLGAVRLLRGDLAGARSTLEEGQADDDGSDGYAQLVRARAELLLEEGDFAAALELTFRLEQHDAAIAVVPRLAAVALAARAGARRAGPGRRGGAARARRGRASPAASGRPGVVGRSLRVLGAVDPDDGEAHLREAVELLERSTARYELAAACAALGTAVRLDRRPTDAREPLRRALELAERCGADGARAAGPRASSTRRGRGRAPRSARGRPRSRRASGASPSSRRPGRTNKEIAQALYVTLKTVEVHLSSSYQKLGIGSRRELEVALAG